MHPHSSWWMKNYSQNVTEKCYFLFIAPFDLKKFPLCHIDDVRLAMLHLSLSSLLIIFRKKQFPFRYFKATIGESNRLLIVVLMHHSFLEWFINFQGQYFFYYFSKAFPFNILQQYGTTVNTTFSIM